MWTLQWVGDRARAVKSRSSSISNIVELHIIGAGVSIIQSWNKLELLLKLPETSLSVHCPEL